MKTVIIAVVLAVMFEGCVKHVPIVIDRSTLEEIPKEMAIDYLNDTVSQSHLTRANPCVFRDDGITSPYDYTKLYTYEEMKMTTFFMTVNNPVLELKIERATGFAVPGFGFTCTVAHRSFTKKDVSEEVQTLTNKVATALKSLGVKIEE